MTIPIHLAAVAILVAFYAGCAWRDSTWRLWLVGYLRVPYVDAAAIDPDKWAKQVVEVE